MKNYGLPYQGSKQKIIDFIINNLPPARHLYDLFGGGGSVTCAALASGNYRHVHCNDINKHTMFLKDCINDTVPGLFRWVSRSEYFLSRDFDDMAFFCYSFNSNGQDYIYSTEIEAYKQALYYARVFKDCSLLEDIGIKTVNRKQVISNRAAVKNKYIKYYVRNILRMDGDIDEIFNALHNIVANKEAYLRDYLKKALKDSGLTQREVGKRLNTNMERHYFSNTQFQFPTREAYAKMREFMPLKLEYDEILQDDKIKLSNYRTLQNLQRLTDFDSLGSYQNQLRIKELGKLKKISHRATFSNLDYREVKVEPGSVIYCDIPYYAASGYEFNDIRFEHEEFYKWALKQRELVIVSEYWMPDDFVCVASLPVVCTFGVNRKDTKEKLFVPRHQLALYKQKLGFLF